MRYVVYFCSQNNQYSTFNRGLEGNKTLQTTIIEARGEKYFEGDSQQSLNAVFYWTPVTPSLLFLSLSLSLSVFSYSLSLEESLDV